MEEKESSDFFKRAVLQVVPELRKERAYWKAKAISLAAENERLHAALKSLALGCKFEDVYEGKFTAAVQEEQASSEVRDVQEEEDDYDEDEEDEETIVLDPEYAAFLQQTRVHQKAITEARDAIELISEEELTSSEEDPIK